MGRPHKTPLLSTRMHNGRPLFGAEAHLFENIDRFHREFGELSANGRKTIAHSSQAERLKQIQHCAEDLHALGHQVQRLSNLKARHVEALIRNWETSDRSPTYMQNHASALRFVFLCLGKVREFPQTPAQCLRDPSRWRRPARTVEYTPKAVGSDIQSIFAALSERDEVIGHLQWLKWMFGLRVEEAIMFRAAEAWRGDHLFIAGNRGPKSGRPRCISLVDFRIVDVCTRTGVPTVDYPSVRADAIELLKESLALSLQNKCGDFPTGTLIPPSMKKKAFMNRERGMTRRAGMTKKDAGWTSHSLRHDYAVRCFETMAGGIGKAWNRHDSLVVPWKIHVERAVRQFLAVPMGHNDPATTAVYAGPVTERAPRNLKRLLRDAIVGRIDQPLVRVTRDGRLIASPGSQIRIANPDQVVGNFELLADWLHLLPPTPRPTRPPASR